MCNVRLQAPTLARKFDIYRWLPLVRTVGWTYSHVITNISGVWGSAYASERARGAPLLTNGIFFNQKALDTRLLKENQALLSFVFKVACTQMFPSRLEFVSRASVHRLCSKHFFPLFFLLLLIVSWSKGTKSSLVYLLRGVISIISELLPCYSF